MPLMIADVFKESIDQLGDLETVRREGLFYLGHVVVDILEVVCELADVNRFYMIIACTFGEGPEEGLMEERY